MTKKTPESNIFNTSRLKLLTWFILLGLSASFIIFYSSTGRPSLVVNFASNISGTSQVFFSNGNLFSSENSTTAHVKKGTNIVNFKIGFLDSALRWDPLSIGSTIDIYDIYISVFGIKIDLHSDSLQPIHQIENIEFSDGKILIKMIEGGNDPQLNVLANFKRVNIISVSLSILIGFLVASSIFICIHQKRRIMSFADNLDKTLLNLRNSLVQGGFSLKEIGILSIIGTILYIYFLSTFSISIDDEMGALRTNPAVWVSQGRWFVYFIEKYLFTQAAIPFSPYLLLIISFAASYALITRTHGFTPSWKTYFCYPFFCAFPTWWFISEFSSNVAALAIGIFLVSLSIFLTFKQERKGLHLGYSSSLAYVLVAIFLSIAISAYQSLLLMFLSMAFGVLLMRVMNATGDFYLLLKKSIKSAGTITLITSSALILYFAINSLAQIFISPNSGYVDGFFNIESILTNPLNVIFAVVREQIIIYSGSSDRYGANIFSLAMLMILSTISIIHIGGKKKFLIILMWIAAITSPFAFHFASGGSALPMRTMISLGYVGWLASMIILYNARPLVVVFSVGLIAILQIQIFSLTSQYIASATITQNHDKALAADIYRRIGESSTDFDRNSPFKIDVYGAKEFSTIYANGWSSTMQASFFAWDGGNIERMVAYMKVMGYGDIGILNNNERAAMIPIFNEMPVWPANGSVKKIDDIYLVRLSKIPDTAHSNISYTLLK